MSQADQPTPLASHEEHERAVADLVRRLATDPGAAALARELERILHYEIEHRLDPGSRIGARLRLGEPRSNRTALISDIHGNHDGLLAVLADIAGQGCDRIVCLGDLVEGGPADEQVVATLMRLGIASVRGNHDEINDVALDPATRALLAALPEQIVEGDLLFVHISPRPIKRKINHAVEAWNVFDECAFRLVFIGHVHIPYIFGKRSSSFGEATLHPFEYNRPFALDPSERYIVSVGSVGYGRDTIGRLRYAIYDRGAGTVELRAIDGPLLPLDTALRWRTLEQ